VTANRAAVAPITGYTYQFDLSILHILRASIDSEVTVEGIEDVDVFSPDESVAVQCKYFSSSKYSLAAMRSAILPMLSAFVGGREWTYRLHVYFQSGSTDVPSSLSLEELKKSLTEDKRTPSPHRVEHFAAYSDSQLTRFLTHFEIVSGLEFGAQRQLVHQELESALNCSPGDARDLFYANALSMVMTLAIRNDEADRRTTRDSFISAINKKMLMFTRWHKEILGEANFTKEIRRRVRAGSLLASVRWRCLIVDGADSWHDQGYVRLQDIAKRLATEDYGPGKLISAKPWTIAIEGDDSKLIELKRFLLESQIPYADGGEMISFQPGLFERPPFHQTAGRGSKIKNSSYSIRVIGVGSLSRFVEHGGTLDTLVSVATSDPSKYLAGTIIHLPGFNPVEFAEITELK
jgi:hypothetical protein